MGTYQEPGDGRKPMWIVYTTEGIEEFSRSILKSSEIEGFDPKKAKELVMEKHYPNTFYFVNLSIEQVLKELRETAPHLVPPTRELKIKTKE